MGITVAKHGQEVARDGVAGVTQGPNDAAGIAALVNPRHEREFARATGQLANRDALDARVLAQFAARLQPPVRPLPDETAQAWAALLARRLHLRTMGIADENLRQGRQAHLGRSAGAGSESGKADLR